MAPFKADHDIFPKLGYIEQINLANFVTFLRQNLYWLRHTGILEDVKHRPRKHVRDDTGHSSSAITDYGEDIEVLRTNALLMKFKRGFLYDGFRLFMQLRPIMNNKTIKVMFDSNTLAPLVTEDYRSSLVEYIKPIRNAIKKGLILPFMSTAWFIDQLPKKIKCSFILTTIIPKIDELDKITSKFNYAYIVCGQQFFYIDKVRNEIIHFNGLCSHSVKVLCARIIPPIAPMNWESQELTTQQLDHITSFTTHKLPTRINVVSHSTPYPKLTKQADFELNQAINLGFKLISTLRIGFGFYNIPPELFIKHDEAASTSIEERYEQANSFIKKNLDLEAGEKLIHEMSNNIRQRNNLPLCSWPSTLKCANDNEVKKISRYIAELCDGDIITGCYAYHVNYLCTEDIAGSQGKKSVFSEENKNKLQRRLGLNILNLKELSTIVSS